MLCCASSSPDLSLHPSQRACDAKYAEYGGLDAYREQAAEKKRAREEAQLQKDWGKAQRSGELVKLLTDSGGASSTRCASRLARLTRFAARR